AATPGAGPSIHAWMGRVYEQLGRTDDAITANRVAIRKSPGAIEPYQNLVRIYLQNGKTNEAFQILEQANKEQVAHPRFLFNLAELNATLIPAYKAETIKPRVLAALDRAIRTKTSNPRLMEKLADGFNLMGEHQRALEVYLKLLEQYPDWPNLREKLAEIYL